MQDVVDALGLYPAEAFRFVEEGLSYTVVSRHGDTSDPNVNRHVSGRDLCLGLRDFGWQRYGLMANLVLERWNVISTLDFGRIVFAMIEHELMQKTDQDTIDDFRNVYDFRTMFETQYKIDPTIVEVDDSKKSRKKSSP